MIQVDTLVKRFGEKTAVQGVSFHAKRGEVLGVLGPNGAGKSTTLRMLCGFLPPTSGSALIDGVDVVRDSLSARRKIGYLPENVPLYPEMRVCEYLDFRGGIKGLGAAARRTSAERVLGLLGLGAVTRQTIGTLSKGYRQRVGLADALLANPPLLVLDEPTVGLDPNQVIEMRALIQSLRGDHTLLLSSHILSEVERVCDRVVIFRDGRVIAEDTPDGLQRQAQQAAAVTIEIAAADRERARLLLDGLGTIDGEIDLGDGWWRLTIAAETDPRVEIFDRARAVGLTLRELSRRSQTLEQIFHELTAGPPALALEDQP